MIFSFKWFYKSKLKYLVNPFYLNFILKFNICKNVFLGHWSVFWKTNDWIGYIFFNALSCFICMYQNKTIADKLMYIFNDDSQNCPFCKLILVVETFEHST